MSADPRLRGRGRLGEVRALVAAGRLMEAERACRAILAREPGNAEALGELAGLARRAGLDHQAAELFAQAVAVSDRLDHHVGLIDSLGAAGEGAAALEACEVAIERYPRNQALHTRRATQLANLGWGEEAREEFERALALDDGPSAPHAGLATLRRYQRANDEHLMRMETLMESEELSLEQRESLCFASARAWDQIGDVERSWARLEEANRLRRSQVDYDAEADRADTARIIERFDAGTMDRLMDQGHDGDRVVLIVGMPRSGSSLVEQVLSAHPDISGAGELVALPRALALAYGEFAPPDGGEILEVLDRMRPGFWKAFGQRYERMVVERAGDAPRVVDKQLYNYTMLGLLHLALPRARIIHTLREPMANCFSCLQATFRADRGYIYSQEDVATAYRLHLELMEHWGSVLPEDVLLTVRYESVVEDLEAEARRMLRFLGLEWDPACLRYYEQEGSVRTHSLTQVRQPIYRDALDRWHRYQHHLGPLREALGDLAEA